MNQSFDPYKVLGVSREASFEEVRKAYRRAATKYHPDAGGDAWVFQQVQQAFEILREKFERSSTQNSSTRTNAEDPRSTPSATTRAETAENQSRANPRRPNSSNSSTSSSNILGRKIIRIELADETSYFILANFMDLVMTVILLRFSGVEVNPIAAYFHSRFGLAGMIALKICSVMVVCGLAQIIAKRSRLKAKALLIAGTLLVAAVVVYSMFLARGLIG